MTSLVQETLQGSVRALAKLISLVEDESEGYREVLQILYPKTGNARIIAVTGSPGVGKSTLVARLAERFVNRKCSVAILAVDPSSEVSGGALLGDRIRMSHLQQGNEIFIRSLSSRGCLGGISQATENVVRVLDAAGRDVIIIETVGVGQDECDVTHVADTSIVVLAPGLGDDIQALKAGITELADIFVINKMDQVGAERFASMLRQLTHYTAGSASRIVPILETIATRDVGVDAVMNCIDAELLFLENQSSLSDDRKHRLRKEIVRRAEHALHAQLLQFLDKEACFEGILQDVWQGNQDPYSASEAVVNRFYDMIRKHGIE